MAKSAPQASTSARTITGRVVSDRMDKTVTVLAQSRVPHPVYGKFIIRSSKFHAHDEENQCRIGDLVTIGETRPQSKTKSWTLVRVEQRSSGARET